VLSAATLATLALLGVVSAATAPNNLDSLVYSLPRQVMWMQAGSVGHFATDRLDSSRCRPSRSTPAST
jgi:hypothetical protein